VFRKNLLIAFVSLVLCGSLYGQATVKGYFLKDSIKIGETVPYVLTARYPKELNVLFPDSTYSFAPFEIESKKYFTTHTENNQSYDSVIYSLSSFEIDSVQRLALPVFVMHQKDCTVVNALTDSIFLQFTVAEIPDSLAVDKLPLKTNTAYLDVKWLLNYPILLIILGAVLVVAIVGWILFRKQIRRYFKVKRLTKNHMTFLEKFGVLVNQADFNYPSAEKAIVLWKNYLENLIDKPIAKYTSKEIIRLQKDEQLKMSLYAVDRMVYGKSPLTIEPYAQLRDYSEQLFKRKLEEVNHHG
jgi:hypothetical protein